MWILYFVCLVPPVTAIFTTVFPCRYAGIGQIMLLLFIFLLSVTSCPFVRLLQLDKEHGIARSHDLFVLIMSVFFIFPIAATIKSFFATVINAETGEYEPYFDFLFLLFVYAPVHYTYLGFAYAIYLKPMILCWYPNYASVVSKEGRVFLNYWNWDGSRKRLPSIDDYDVKGNLGKSPRKPLCFYVVDEEVLGSIKDNRHRKGFATCSCLSLIFALLAGLCPVLVGFDFNDAVGILFFALCVATYAFFISFSAKLLWLQSKYHVFKNVAVLWTFLVFEALIAPGFALGEFFSAGGCFAIHPIDFVALLFFVIIFVLFLLLVYYAYLSTFWRHRGKRD